LLWACPYCFQKSTLVICIARLYTKARRLSMQRIYFSGGLKYKAASKQKLDIFKVHAMWTDRRTHSNVTARTVNQYDKYVSDNRYSSRPVTLTGLSLVV
jgi:hypothetical protein